jgi:hypothetical protein
VTYDQVRRLRRGDVVEMRDEDGETSIGLVTGNSARTEEVFITWEGGESDRYPHRGNFGDIELYKKGPLSRTA